MSREILDFNFTDLVFVYGSLKDGYWNNGFLATSELMYESETEARFILTDVGFPYAIPEEVLGSYYDLSSFEEMTPAPVRGEVWRLESPRVLRNLDRLEGTPTHYHRVPTIIMGVPVWMYQQYDDQVLAYSEICPIVNGAYEWHETSRLPATTAFLG